MFSVTARTSEKKLTRSLSTLSELYISKQESYKVSAVLPQTRGPECLHLMLFIYAGLISIRKYLVLYCSLLCASLDEMKGIW